MAEHSSGYNAIMKIYKAEDRYYSSGEITSDWLDVAHACYLAQIRATPSEYWHARKFVQPIVRDLKAGHSYYPTLGYLVKQDVLEEKRVPKGVQGRTECWYRVKDVNGVAIALRKLGYPL